jgi:multidrug efflux pump subunit AcrB
MIPIALRRPITILVIFLGLMLFSVVALKTIPIDIFPKLNAPTIYVIEQYGGMSAQQMEGFFATRMADQFLYINGIKNIESKNIQGLTLLKLSFYEGRKWVKHRRRWPSRSPGARPFSRRAPCRRR